MARRTLSPEEWLERDETDGLPEPARRRTPRPSELVAASEDLGKADGAGDEELQRETVVGLDPGRFALKLAGEIFECPPPSGAFASSQSLAPGDEVAVAFGPGGAARIAALLPRRSCLSRPDPHLAHRERVIAANVDLAVLVVSVASPPLRPRLIDRYLVAIAHGGAQPALAVNKLDLLASEVQEAAALAELAPYRALELPIVFCSAASGRGIAELAALLAGQTAVLVGHSGVGKTSLLNALVPAAAAETGAVGARGGKGRHTTSRSVLHALPGGGRLIDTPGVREFGLWDLAPRELAVLFPERGVLAEHCRFADCSHSHEPGCAVTAAVEAGELPASRHATYLRLLASLGSATD